jgi:S1-C subfamily serine protease
LGSAAILSSALTSCSAPNKSAQSASSADSQSQHIDVRDNFDASTLEQQFAAVAKHISPCVVAISATEGPVDLDPTLASHDINADKLARLLDTVDRTVGTGFVIDSDGFIVTNEHVVAKAQQLWVTTDTRKVYPAIVVSSDARSDLAVLKIPARGMTAARYSQFPARRGQWTLAVGNPYGLASAGEMAVSIGVVSATSRSLPRLSGKEDRLYSDLIQTTAQINPGNSGGPLFNLAGDVIGINTAVILPQKQTNGIGFAIPTDTHVRRVIDDLKQGREIVHGHLGVSVSSATASQCTEAGLGDNATGVRVEAVEPGSPAATKFQVGDIIAEIDGVPVRDSEEFVRLIGLSRASDPIDVVYYRSGRMTANLRMRPRVSQNVADSSRVRWHGLLLGPIPQYWDFAPTPRPESGVMVIGVDSRNPVATGVRCGSVITAVGNTPVRDLAEFRTLVAHLPAAQCRLHLAGASEAVVSAD